MMKKITFVCKYLGKGGAERVMSILINYYAQLGWDVQLILLYENLVEYDIPKTVNIVYLGWDKYKSVFQIVPRLKQLRNAINGDYVIAFIYAAIRDTIFATLGLKKTIIISDRSDPSKEPAGKLRQCIRSFSYLFADIIVFQTEDAKCFFCNSIRKKGVIISNPISNNLPPRYRGERKKIIVAAGRLDKQKNFPLLIRAFSKLHMDYPDYVLKIFGCGPEENFLNQLVSSLGLENYIEFPGYVFDVDEQMRDAALYVSSSDYEGISNSMLEALAMGVPAVCTDCPVGGARGAIIDGVSGVLVPVGDEGRLYQAMKKVLSDKSFSNMLSDNAVKIRDELSDEKIVTQWINIME